MKRDKEGHYIMIKGSIQEDITIINICALNIEALQYVRQMLTSMKGEINDNTIIVRDFKTSFTPTLSDPMDCSLPGSSIHGTLQKRTLEWIAIAFAKESP